MIRWIISQNPEKKRKDAGNLEKIQKFKKVKWKGEKMENRLSERSAAFESAWALGVVALMAAEAGIFHEKDIIFPEVGALTIGFWAAPACPWQVSGWKAVVMMLAAALAGFLTVNFVPAPFAVQILISFCAAAALIIQSRTRFYPVFSAAMLPVVLRGANPAYLASVAVFATGVILTTGWLKWGRQGRKARPERISPPGPLLEKRVQILRFAVFLGFVLILGMLGERLGHQLLIAPPLIVGTAGIVDDPSPIPLANLFKIGGLCLAAAVFGAGCRLALTLTMGFAPWLTAAAAFALVLLVSWRFGLWFPPAGAVAVLAYLIPKAAVRTYPLWAGLGALGLGISAVAVRLLTRKAGEKLLRL